MLTGIYAKWFKWGAVIIAILVISGLVYDRLFSRPKEKIVTETKIDTKTQEKVIAQEKKQAETEAYLQQIATAMMELRQSKQTDTNRKETEIRYIIPPGSTNANTPLIIQTPSGPQSLPVIPQTDGTRPVQPIEITVKTSELIDRSKEETNTNTKQETVTNAETKEKENSESITETDKTLEHKEEVKTVVETGGSGNKEISRRLGIALTSQAKPALTYDFVQPNLGPKPLGLGKLGLGAFVTQTPSNKIGFGPQVNYQRKSLFGGVGYELTEKKTLFMVGLKF